jgi:hypothetical protein
VCKMLGLSVGEICLGFDLDTGNVDDILKRIGQRLLVICENHDRTAGLCKDCGRRHAVLLSAGCTNCNYGIGGGVFIAFATTTPLLSFLLNHDINPISPDAADRHQLNRIHEDYGEDVLGRDPLTARFTTTVDGDEFSLTIDDELNVIGTSH